MKAMGLAALFCLLLSFPAVAVIESYEFEDDSLRLRFQTLSQELRCPKCQNQNIADSNAPIAKDLREQLHRQLQSGASDEAIKQYIVDRYGEFVLYRPRVEGVTLWLWLTPLLLLMAGVGVLAAVLRRPKRPRGQLSEAEQARLDKLVGDEHKESS